MPKPPATLRNRALALLSRREHSRLELLRKLKPHTEDEAELETLLDDFAQRGWLSDARFAESWVHGRAARYGGTRLKAELCSKGVAAETIDDTLAHLQTSEAARARDIWQRKFGSPATDAKERARQLRFLATRGFSLDVIYAVVGGDWDDE
ncbi:recombination regulator RecX [Chitiniphilus eburneus]|uniref:recombination regulator RecX n=1 Tax=Chitiniphilus eburneus TaxID=2571148 RepID=UPI001B7FA313|nr:recombination regulator RecX [Chitiniphilus eburneus]